MKLLFTCVKQHKVMQTKYSKLIQYHKVNELTNTNVHQNLKYCSNTILLLQSMQNYAYIKTSLIIWELRFSKLKNFGGSLPSEGYKIPTPNPLSNTSELRWGWRCLIRQTGTILEELAWLSLCNIQDPDRITRYILLEASNDEILMRRYCNNIFCVQFGSNKLWVCSNQFNRAQNLQQN